MEMEASTFSEPFKKDLPCELTEVEILDYSRTLARLTQDLEQMETRKKSAMAQFNDDIARIKSELSSIARKIGNGEEMRQVECQWAYTWALGIKRLLRQDTKEVIRQELVTQEDRQKRLPLEPGGEKPPVPGPDIQFPTE